MLFLFRQNWNDEFNGEADENFFCGGTFSFSYAEILCRVACHNSERVLVGRQWLFSVFSIERASTVPRVIEKVSKVKMSKSNLHQNLLSFLDIYRNSFWSTRQVGHFWLYWSCWIQRNSRGSQQQWIMASCQKKTSWSAIYPTCCKLRRCGGNGYIEECCGMRAIMFKGL